MHVKIANNKYNVAEMIVVSILRKQFLMELAKATGVGYESGLQHYNSK